MATAPAPNTPLLAGRIPDFFIVGHAKSGTTALYEMLRRHPEIFMPDAKEPWFFASDMRPRFPPRKSARVWGERGRSHQRLRRVAYAA